MHGKTCENNSYCISVAKLVQLEKIRLMSLSCLIVFEIINLRIFIAKLLKIWL